MNIDEYNEVINGEKTFAEIAKCLINDGKCIIGWTDEQCDHRDILFTFEPKHLGGVLQRGLIWCYLYVSIMDFSSMGFLIEDDNNNVKSNEYIKEKLRLHDNHCDEAICDLINGVISQLDILRS